MDLPKLALGGVVIATLFYLAFAVFGLFFIGPAGIIGAIVFIFIALLFFGVLQSRLRNKEDDYYEKNIKD